MWWGKASDEAAVDKGNKQTGASSKPMELRGDQAATNASSSGTADLAEGLLGLYDRSELCDVVLRVGDERFPVHKAILASMSATFREYLQQASETKAAAENALQGILVAHHTAAIPDDRPASEGSAAKPEPSAQTAAPAEDASASAPDVSTATPAASSAADAAGASEQALGSGAAAPVANAAEQATAAGDGAAAATAAAPAFSPTCTASALAFLGPTSPHLMR